MCETAKIFTNGGSQALRIPKEFRYDTNEVMVNRIGNIMIVTPKNNKWSGLLQSLDMFTDDFMADGRGKLPAQEREEL